MSTFVDVDLEGMSAFKYLKVQIFGNSYFVHKKEMMNAFKNWYSKTEVRPESLIFDPSTNFEKLQWPQKRWHQKYIYSFLTLKMW